MKPEWQPCGPGRTPLDWIQAILRMELRILPENCHAS